MATLIRTWHLANGLKVEILDGTVSVYGDYSSVRLTIRCRVGVRREYLAPFEARPDYRRVADALGSEVEYLREITKAGVPGRNLSGVKAFLVERFEENALGYFERADFPEKLVQKKFTEVGEELSRNDRSGDGGR